MHVTARRRGRQPRQRDHDIRVDGAHHEHGGDSVAAGGGAEGGHGTATVWKRPKEEALRGRKQPRGKKVEVEEEEARKDGGAVLRSRSRSQSVKPKK